MAAPRSDCYGIGKGGHSCGNGFLWLPPSAFSWHGTMSPESLLFHSRRSTTHTHTFLFNGNPVSLSPCMQTLYVMNQTCEWTLYLWTAYNCFAPIFGWNVLPFWPHKPAGSVPTSWVVELPHNPEFSISRQTRKFYPNSHSVHPTMTQTKVPKCLN